MSQSFKGVSGCSDRERGKCGGTVRTEAGRMIEKARRLRDDQQPWTNQIHSCSLLWTIAIKYFTAELVCFVDLKRFIYSLHTTMCLDLAVWYFYTANKAFTWEAKLCKNEFYEFYYYFQKLKLDAKCLIWRNFAFIYFFKLLLYDLFI